MMEYAKKIQDEIALTEKQIAGLPKEHQEVLEPYLNNIKESLSSINEGKIAEAIAALNKL